MNLVEEKDNTELCEECGQGMYYEYAWIHLYSGDRHCWPESDDPREREIVATRHAPDCTDAIVTR